MNVAGNEKLEWALFIICDALIIVLAYFDRTLYDWGPCGEVDGALVLLALALTGEGMYFYWRYVFRQGSHKAVSSAWHKAITKLEPVQTIPGVKGDGESWVYPPMGVWVLGISFPVLAVRHAIVVAPLYMVRTAHGLSWQLGKFHAYDGDNHYRLPPHVLAKLDARLFTLGETTVYYPPTLEDHVAVRKGQGWMLAKDARVVQSTETEEQTCLSINRALEEEARLKAELRKLIGTPEIGIFDSLRQGDG